MWKYIKRYLPFAILAALFMIGEVMMDLIQPGLMSKIVDDGVLGVNTGGIGDLNLIWTLGIKMILLVLLGGFCGSMNNVFVHMSGQNIGNEMRKDCFRNLMKFSFPQLDRFGTGSLCNKGNQRHYTGTEFCIAVCARYDPHDAPDIRQYVFYVPFECHFRFDCPVRLPLYFGLYYFLSVQSESAFFQTANAA